MNIKVRLRNKTFWLGVIPATISFVYTILASFDIVPAISEALLIKLASVVISALALFGVFVDPTTKGARDSLRALAYELPNDDRATKEKEITGETPHIEDEDDDLK